MTQPSARISYALIAGIVVASGIATWIALTIHNRPAVPGGAGTAPDRVAVPAPIATRAPGATATPTSGGGTPGISDTTLDRQQDDKIVRGLTTNPRGGILVSSVPPYSVVSQLRVEAGDVIVSVNGRPVGSLEEFVRIYREQGLPRQMTVIHHGREMHHH